MVSPHLHPAAGTRTRHPLLSKASFPVSLEIEQQSGLWLRPMIPTSLLCMSAASCPTPAAKVSSVVELSLNPPLNAAFDLVPPGSSSSVGSAALHPDAIIDAIDPGGSSAGVWEDHELASDFPDDAPLVIADELLHRWVASLIELLDLESPTELLDLESP